ncbi:MAG: pyrimidine-nucleoside phosphorylase, partial [Clostridia bacterium]|nr:pyrimidine-nucleoside phosphorylase [Clostridia bacterium]
GNIPLIATSIMSKKLAAGAKNIVLDVKTGDGAFMGTVKAAEELAEKMVEIGTNNGRNVSALITDMNHPLGYNVGNSLEVIEAIEVLKGNVSGPLYEVSVYLAGELIHLATGTERKLSYEKAEKSISDGSALLKLKEMIKNQGGDTDVIDDYSLFKQAKHKIEIRSFKQGFISDIKAKSVGDISMLLGAGRVTKTSDIDMSAGIVLTKSVGDQVFLNELIATLYTDKEEIEEIEEKFMKVFSFSDQKPEKHKTVIARITKDETKYF